MQKIKHAAARKLEPQDITINEINAILRRLQVIDDWSKKFGCRMGLIGESGMKVFRYLAFSYMAKGWACFPSYRHIANKVNLARSTVGDALRRLKRVGALCWKQRRRWHNGRLVQGANLFRIAMPSLTAKFMPLLTRVRKSAMGVKIEGALGRLEASISARKFSASGERPHGATTDLLLKESGGAPSARTVFDRKAEIAVGDRRVSSQEGASASRLEVALARFADGISKKRKHGKA